MVVGVEGFYWLDFSLGWGFASVFIFSLAVVIMYERSLQRDFDSL